MNRFEKMAKRICGAIEVDLMDKHLRLPSGGMAGVSSVGFDGRNWYWKDESGAKNSYSDESRFRYSLSQELMSQQKAMALMRTVQERLGDSMRASRVAAKKYRTVNQIRDELAIMWGNLEDRIDEEKEATEEGRSKFNYAPHLRKLADALAEAEDVASGVARMTE